MHDSQVNPHMNRALELARRAFPACAPNPAVGCVLVSGDGQVLGQGHTQVVGGAHAEVMALRDARERGHATQGCTAYVTLEPCSHHGRTGPCCDALIAAGVASVVVAVQDPNPQVAGRGLARLRAAGVQVSMGPGAQASRELNLGFFRRMQAGRPWVRLKLAASLDGRTALPDGSSQWITSEPARADGHRWRARAGAVLTGTGTVLHDDPLLNVRGQNVVRQPALAILDSHLRTPLRAQLWSVPQRPVWIYTAVQDPARQRALEALGAEVLRRPGAGGRVDLLAVLQDLARREVNELHVECGAVLAGALCRQALVDELLLYQAPRLLGAGRGLVELGTLESIAAGPRFEYVDCARVGPDFRIRARVAVADKADGR